MILLVSQAVLAVNLDFSITPSKKAYYPNETIPLEIAVINRDASWAASSMNLNILIGQRSYNYDIGKLEPSQSYKEKITLPEQPPGTYSARGILNYSWLDTTFATESYGSFEVLFPQVERMPRNVYVKSFDLPENITAGKTYDVSVNVANEGTVDGKFVIELEGLNVSKSKETSLKAGESSSISIPITFYNSGLSLVEAKVYAVVNDIKYLLNYNGKQVFVKESNVAKIEFDKIELVDESDNTINQEDTVKLKVYIKNTGNYMASNVKAVLTSSITGIEITKSEINYELISVTESIAPDTFEIKTAKVEPGKYSLELGISFVDSESHTIKIDIPINIEEGYVVCLSDNDCDNNEICSNSKCEKISCECGEIKNHRCIKYGCCSNSDCSLGLGCDISTHTCIKCSDTHCCSIGKIWCEQKDECLKPTECVGYPIDTSCQSGWPSHLGSIVSINEQNNACDLFEVKNSQLLSIAQEAANCFSDHCQNANCHKFCGTAYTQSGANYIQNSDTFKKFTGLYMIYGLGPAAKFMNGYFSAEIKCGSGTGVCESKYGYNNYVQQLQCKGSVGHPEGWSSDTDMTQNSCLFSDLPAHVNINILQTGTCVDYSISLTTLLRYIGYNNDEVYSVTGPGHEYNLIKFPGDSKWNVIDTVGNNPSPYVSNDVPGTWFPYCKYYPASCSNDAGQTNCPIKSEVKGC